MQRKPALVTKKAGNLILKIKKDGSMKGFHVTCEIQIMTETWKPTDKHAHRSSPSLIADQNSSLSPQTIFVSFAPQNCKNAANIAGLSDRMADFNFVLSQHYIFSISVI